MKIKGSGNYFNGSFSETTNNTLTFKYRYREYGETTWGSYTTINPTISNNTYSFDVLAGSNFDYRKQYEFQFVVNDKLMEVTLEETSKPGIPLMWLGKNYMELDGKKAFDWEDDLLKIMGEIYLGNTGAQLNDFAIELETDDTPIKTPFKLDGRWVYIYRQYLGQLPNGHEFYPTPLLESEVKDILIIFGTAVRDNSGQYNTWFNLGTARRELETQIGLNTDTIDGYINFSVHTGQDRTSLYGTATMLFTYND
jgi:hypothetical protein